MTTVAQPNSIPGSVRIYAAFVVHMLSRYRRQQRVLHKISQRRRTQTKTGTLGTMLRRWQTAFCQLEQQRRNIVALADIRRAIVVPSMATLLLGALCTSTTPYWYARATQLVATVDAASNSMTVPLSNAVWTLLGLGVTTTLGALLTGLRGAFFWMAGSRANARLRCQLQFNLLCQEAAFFDQTEVGTLISRLNSDVNKIGSVISYHVNVVVRQSAQFVFGSAYLIKISPRLSCVAFAGIGVVAYVAAVYGRFYRYLAEQTQTAYAHGTAVAETSFRMSETIRAYDGVQVEANRYQVAQGKVLNLEEVQAWGYGTHKFVSDTLQALLWTLLMFLCWRVGKVGHLTGTQLTTFLFYTDFCLESSNEVGDQWAKIQGAVGASTKVFDLVRRIPLIRDPDENSLSNATRTTIESNPASFGRRFELNANDVGPNVMEMVNGHDGTELPIIALSNVTMIYDSMETPAVENLSLSIRRGDRLAIVGRSGSGKSTVLRMMLRFYDPTSGTVSLEGADLKQQTRKDLAKRLALVPQEPELFPAPLVDNVLYGLDKDDANGTSTAQYSKHLRDAAREVLQLCGLPMHPGNELGLTLDSRIGDGGRALSGGQRQRVAVARALVRQPKMLLLDEPTAALDSQSESAVVNALQQAMQYADSMVLVTHRLNVIRAMGVNRIVVMERGEIVEEGEPEQLLGRADSIYGGLAREQGIWSSSTPLN